MTSRQFTCPLRCIHRACSPVARAEAAPSLQWKYGRSPPTRFDARWLPPHAWDSRHHLLAYLQVSPGSVCVPERAVCEQSERVDAIVDFVETSGVLSQFTQSLFVPAFLCLSCTRPTNLLASTSTCRPWLSPTSWPPSLTTRSTLLVHRARRRLRPQPLVDPRKWL